MVDQLVPSRVSSSVLVVEDDTVSRQRLTTLLRREGFDVAVARSGVEAVRKARSEGPQVVLMDILMPGEYDGIDAAKLIMKENPAARIIFTSAFADFGEYHQRIEAIGLGGLAFFDKPFAIAEQKYLVELIEATYLEGREPTQKIWSHDAPGIVTPGEIVVLNSVDLLLYKHLQAHPDLIKALEWRVFEKLLADILETFGYKVQLMQGTKDGGIDVVAIGKPEPWGEHLYLVQAKRWNNREGVEPVRQLKFLHDHEGATRSCLATTSTFTQGAWRLAQDYPWQLELRDYIGLRQWVDKAILLKQGIVWDV